MWRYCDLESNLPKTHTYLPVAGESIVPALVSLSDLEAPDLALQMYFEVESGEPRAGVQMDQAVWTVRDG